MAYKDLQDFIDTLEQKKLLKRIKAQVDSRLEITEIADRVVKRGGPALLFENVKGSEYPVLINAFGSYERLNLALEVGHIDELAGVISDFMDMSSYLGLMNKIKALPKLTRLTSVFPRKVAHAACQEVVEEPDLDKLPILHCWPAAGS